jgi:hypothetical protein
MRLSTAIMDARSKKRPVMLLEIMHPQTKSALPLMTTAYAYPLEDRNSS